jgi:UDP-N-acetylglucosamine 2-epimerase (non-hydrolysing)
MAFEKSKLKVMTIVGTRPEIIRLSMVLSLLDKMLTHVLVHTGQNYDYELNEIFFNELKIRTPDHYLNINTTTLGNILGETLIKTEAVIRMEVPDAILILGDTNSSIAAIIAKRLRIPVYHMEAGNRSFDLNVPEEINRKIIDHIADFNLVYTENARRHLLSEGLQHRRIYLTGSPMYEVLNNYKNDIENSVILSMLNITPKEYFVVSIHREENVENRENLNQILSILNSLASEYRLPVIVSTHPRTRKILSSTSCKSLDEKIRFLKPFGFFDYINLQKNAMCTISDSGTISEESAILSFPAISLRNSMERPEAIDSGTIILSSLIPEIALDSIRLTIEEHSNSKYDHIPSEYMIKNTSYRVLKLIMGTAKLSNKWDGIVCNQ